MEACNIPEVADGPARIRVVAGRVGETEGPVRGVVIDPEYLDVTLEGEDPWRHPTTPGHTVFAYAVTGDTLFGEGSNGNGDADATRVLPALSTALFADGDTIVARAVHGRSRFLLVSGRPLREPVAWYGPIVMNTDEELQQAFREYRDGTFVRHATKGDSAE